MLLSVTDAAVTVVLTGIAATVGITDAAVTATITDSDDTAVFLFFNDLTYCICSYDGSEVFSPNSTVWDQASQPVCSGLIMLA